MKLAVNFGVYDPERSYDGPMAIEHFFIQWNAYNPSKLKGDLERASKKGRWPLITVEPWPYNRDEVGTRKLFSDIKEGKYDQAIVSICADIKEFRKSVFVRWGHEMEYVTGRYPWAQVEYSEYISAYRYFVDTCRSMTKNIVYVWSPAGNKGLQKYWPGREYADYVGVSVYGFPDHDLFHYGKVHSFDEIFAEKYMRVEGFDRPIMITELGVTGGKGHQFSWVNEAMRSFPRYPLLKSIVYFNAIDSRSAWPKNFAVPDWQIDLNLFPSG